MNRPGWLRPICACCGEAFRPRRINNRWTDACTSCLDGTHDARFAEEDAHNLAVDANIRDFVNGLVSVP